jgi:hypothetical protein
VKHPGKILARPRLLLPPLALLIVGLFEMSSACQGPTPSAKLQTAAQAAKANETRMAMVRPLPLCPQAGVAPIQASQPETGHHKVTLSWNASPSTPDTGSNPVGYCLYRSTTQNAARKKPTCSACEQINRVPITGTSCLDDLVIDSTRYYYVVAAVNIVGTISSSSNEVRVQIPPQNESGSPLSSPPPPACRGTSTAH